MIDLIQFAGETKKAARINGHEFRYHLLDTAEELSIGTLSAPYIDTVALDKCLKTAAFALSVDSIDGQPLYDPLMERTAEETDMAKFKRAAKLPFWWIETWFAIYAKEKDGYEEKLEEAKKK